MLRVIYKEGNLMIKITYSNLKLDYENYPKVLDMLYEKVLRRNAVNS